MMQPRKEREGGRGAPTLLPVAEVEDGRHQFPHLHLHVGADAGDREGLLGVPKHLLVGDAFDLLTVALTRIVVVGNYKHQL
jgi:hypothetical protein